MLSVEIQLVSNNLPPGETIQVPLGQNISRQNNAIDSLNQNRLTQLC
ncbi:MAG: hypothetical protein ACK5QF_00900 [Dolichospermum sp.]